MKLQYLGDSKDSFKWDYLHFLVEALGYNQLKIVWMMTPDDDGPDGKTSPDLFPARQEILCLCKNLRSTRDPKLLYGMPATTHAQYAVSFHDPNENLAGSDQVMFLDPDNGFEPEHHSSDKHVRYSNLDRLIKTISPGSVVTVFQHFRFKKFSEDFARIRERLFSGYSTAIYWHALMFVSVSSSAETIHRVSEINREYAKHHPVKVID